MQRRMMETSLSPSVSATQWRLRRIPARLAAPLHSCSRRHVPCKDLHKTPPIACTAANRSHIMIRVICARLHTRPRIIQCLPWHGSNPRRCRWEDPPLKGGCGPRPICMLPPRLLHRPRPPKDLTLGLPQLLMLLERQPVLHRAPRLTRGRSSSDKGRQHRQRRQGIRGERVNVAADSGPTLLDRSGSCCVANRGGRKRTISSACRSWAGADWRSHSRPSRYRSVVQEHAHPRFQPPLRLGRA